MNIDVCRKCIASNFVVVPSSYRACDNARTLAFFDAFSYEPVCVKQVGHGTEHNSAMFDQSEPQVWFEFLTVDRDCPFYAEHSVHDWNKKNEH